MSTDGAHDGMNAHDAMKAAIAGDQPEPEALMTVQQMRDYLLSATFDDMTYEGCARYAAKLILEWLMEDPPRANGPTENVYQHEANGQMTWPAVVLQEGWYELMCAGEEWASINQLGLSGFQWGWAVNAARRCVELPEVPNPAIMIIGED